MIEVTVQQAYLMGYGCKDCRHWDHQVADMGNCSRQIFALTLCSEICEHLEAHDEVKHS